MTTDASMDGDLPRSLQLLWGRGGKPARPRRQALSLERIVAAAIEIADTEGLGALSMARLAERLSSAPMSLYRHVASKDELQVFMMDAAVGEAPPVDPAEDWRAGLVRWTRELRAVYFRHPWILHIPMTGPPLEPGQLAWVESALRMLDPTGLRPDEKMAVALTILSFARGDAQLSLSLLEARRRAGITEKEMDERYARTLRSLLDADRFPALTAVFEAAEPGADDQFTFGLERVLDGVEALIRSRSPAQP